jgi:hypothetical protein
LPHPARREHLHTNAYYIGINAQKNSMPALSVNAHRSRLHQEGAVMQACGGSIGNKKEAVLF